MDLPKVYKAGKNRRQLGPLALPLHLHPKGHRQMCSPNVPSVLLRLCAAAQVCCDWKALKPTVVRDLFECRAAYAEAPVELMKEWADDHLPNFEEDPDGECASQPLLTKQTAPQFVRVLFALLERQGAKLAPPKLPKRAKEKGI